MPFTAERERETERETETETELINYTRSKNMKRLTEKPFYYNHLINDFIVDTMHLDIPHKYAYLTLIWEAHRQRGVVTNQSLETLCKKNQDIEYEVYIDVLNEFWDEDEHGYTNPRVLLDLEKTKQHKDRSSEGAKTTNLKKMVKSDKRLDELRQLNKMMPSTGNKRVSETEGLVKYCKKLQEDKRFTFERIKQIIKSFDGRGDSYYPALSVIFNDTEGRFWKVEQELTSTQKDILLSKVEKKLRDKGYSWVGHAERNAIPEFKEIYKLTKEEL